MENVDAFGASLHDDKGAFLLDLSVHKLTPGVSNMHTHQNLEISTVLDGSGVYRIGDRKYDLKKGDVIILNNIEPHGLVLTKSMTHLVMHFEPSFIWNALSNDWDYDFLLIFFERGENFSHRLDRKNHTTTEISNMMISMYNELQNQQSYYELMLKIKLQTILVEIMRNYDYIDKTKTSAPLPVEYIPGLNEVNRYINENLEKDIKIPELAEILHVSPSYFSMLFKRFNLVTPIEYITHKRIKRAIELIRTTSLNLSEIAYKCGFNNNTNFYKAFKKVTGKTPSFYRRSLD